MGKYSRFYAVLGKIPYSDREEMKKSIVRQYTWNRTEHVSEMTPQEYDECCSTLERMTAPDERAAYTRERKRKRSAALHQLQLYGVDTADWGKVNEFCKQPRIAGKEFRELTLDELDALTVKMRAIIAKRATTLARQSEQSLTESCEE